MSSQPSVAVDRFSAPAGQHQSANGRTEPCALPAESRDARAPPAAGWLCSGFSGLDPDTDTNPKFTPCAAGAQGVWAQRAARHPRPQSLTLNPRPRNPASKPQTIGPVPQARKAHGRNELPEDPGTPFWKLVLKQFDDYLVKILIAAAVVDLLIALTGGDYSVGWVQRDPCHVAVCQDMQFSSAFTPRPLHTPPAG